MKKQHQFYLTESYSEEMGSGYMVKKLNSKGEVEYVQWTSPESLDWFRNKDYAIVSEEEWREIGEGAL